MSFKTMPAAASGSGRNRSKVLTRSTNTMKSKPLFIADGHHRYETALNYQRLRRQQAGAPNRTPAV